MTKRTASVAMLERAALCARERPLSDRHAALLGQLGLIALKAMRGGLADVAEDLEVLALWVRE